MKRLLCCFGGVLATSAALQAQVLLSGGLSYSQNFDALGTANVNWTDNSTANPLGVGWYASRAYSASATPQTYGPYEWTIARADSGGNNAGALFNYGTTGASDRALGSVASGTTAGGTAQTPEASVIGVAFQADSVGSAGTYNVTVSYTGEEWRNGGNTSAQTIFAFAYALNPSLSGSPLTISAHSNDVQYASVSALNFVSPTTGATAGALDGNNAANRTSISATINNVTLAMGDTIMLRWADINDAGNDHGGAIDDLTVTFTAVPEPASVILAGLGLCVLTIFRRRK